MVVRPIGRMAAAHYRVGASGISSFDRGRHAASGLDNMTGDPIDRFIVATALVEDAVLLTADGSLLASGGAPTGRA